MFRKLLALVGITAASTTSALAGDKFAPYTDPSINQIYNWLFCDDPTGFRPKPGESPTIWQAVLFATPVDPQSVLLLAEDTNNEGRIRALAYNWLRQNGHQIPKQKLLGVIVEVPFPDGLDVLATFSDGGIRYINKTGKLAVVEGGLPESKPILDKLFAASQEIVKRIGPWDQHRLPPPANGKVRLTFLVSDGLYFGEGPLSVMQREPMAAPVIQHATELLQLVVKASNK